MTPKTVFFTGLELDPADLQSRIHRGVIPPDWQRCRFLSSVLTYKINAWLTQNIDGRWAILTRFYPDGQREVTVAFEQVADAVMFKLSDGPNAISTANMDE